MGKKEKEKLNSKKGLKKTGGKSVNTSVFGNDVVEKVQEANNIVDVISEYIELKPEGKEMVGLCPFHNDHKPSLKANKDKQLFKCFSCGAGGDVFKFIQQYEKISFSQAVKRLAARAKIELKKIDWEKRFAIFQENVKDIPVIAELLAEQLDVSVSSLNQLGVGFYPLEQSYIFPERNASGAIVGLLKRREDGKKYIEDTGQRGLYYQHPLPNSDKTVYVCEGLTDTLYALNMGYVAVGKPNAGTGNSLLAKLLKGRNVVIVGDNDEAGRKGVEETFEILKAVCQSVIKVLPPNEGDDLRKWHPTVLKFEAYVEKLGKKKSNNNMIQLVDYDPLAKEWLMKNYQLHNHRLLHRVPEIKEWYRHNGVFYQKIDGEWIENQIRTYFRGYKILDEKSGRKTIKPLVVNKHFVDEVKHALRPLCCIEVPENIYTPFYIGMKKNIDLSRAVVFRNGIYHVLENRFEQLTSDIFITSTLPFDYNPNTKCSTFLGTIETDLSGDEECIALLQEWFGYNLIASNHMQQMMFFFGIPNSGKTTIVNILQRMLGPDKCCALNFANLSDKHGLESAIGKQSIIISEEELGKKKDAGKILQRIKRITGGSWLPVEPKYKVAIQLKPIWRITYDGNEMLPFPDDAGALTRRTNILYFPNDFSKNPKRDLEDILTKEIQGIAIWALEGLRRLLKNDNFTVPKASESYLEEFKRITNHIKAMIEETCQRYEKDRYQHYAFTDDIFDVYKGWCQDNGITPVNKRSFGRKLKSNFPFVIKGQIREQGDQKRIYRGIEILPGMLKKYCM